MRTTRKQPAMSAELKKANSSGLCSINQTKQLHRLPAKQMIHSHKLGVHEY